MGGSGARWHLPAFSKVSMKLLESGCFRNKASAFRLQVHQHTHITSCSLVPRLLGGAKSLGTRLDKL